MKRTKTGAIAVLGAGSWGTALATQFARSGRPTRLWARHESAAAAIRDRRCNERYLPEVALPPSLEVTSDLVTAIGSGDEILLAVPSHSLRATVLAVRDSGADIAGLAWATKGIELDTGLLPHQIVAELLPADLPTAVLSGPTFAHEVAIGLPSAMTVASASEPHARLLAEALSTGMFRAYISSDVTGVEVGGAAKNVFAIGAGLSDGLGFGANTRAALITRALAEMTRLGVALGAQRETFTGLAGVGDLVLTCTDNQSRNRRFGLALANGETVEAALASIGQVVEGYFAARAVHQVARREAVDMPIVDQLFHVLYEGRDPRAAVDALMKRPIMRED